jgi:sporulation protein YlmC with PRC-barrel domain
MKINDELIGKEVIDASGDQVGVVKDVEWNPQTNSAEYILLQEAGLSAKIGLGDKKMLPIGRVESIGDKVLIKGTLLKNED